MFTKLKKKLRSRSGSGSWTAKNYVRLSTSWDLLGQVVVAVVSHSNTAEQNGHDTRQGQTFGDQVAEVRVQNQNDGLHHRHLIQRGVLEQLEADTVSLCSWKRIKHVTYNSVQQADDDGDNDRANENVNELQNSQKERGSVQFRVQETNDSSKKRINAG